MSSIFNLKYEFLMCLIFFSNMHKVVISGHLRKNEIKPDDKLLITGKLKTKPFTLQNDKNGTSFKIIAQQVYHIDNGEPNETISPISESELEPEFEWNRRRIFNKGFHVKDENEVQLESFIWSEIQHENKFSVFYLALRLLTRYFSIYSCIFKMVMVNYIINVICDIYI